MRTLKSLSRRSLALLLTLVMMTGMVNLSAFAADEPQQDYDEPLQLPSPLEISMQIEALNEEIDALDPEDEGYEEQLADLQGQLAALEAFQYPMEDSVLLAMDGRGYESLGEFLFGIHPKNGLDQLPEGGVWSAEGKWEEDNSDVLVMDENGHATINEPKGPQAQVTVKYTYTHEVEITAPAADTAPKADAAPEVAAPVEGEGDKAEAPADGEQKAEGAEPQEPSEPAEGDQEQDAADVNPDEENSGEEPAPEIAPDQEEDAEGAGEAENNGEEPAPEVVPAEDNTAEDQGEADAEIPENAETAPETSEGKNGEEGDEGEDGVQPEPSEPAEAEPAEDPSEEVPATTTQQVEETLTWTVVFTSEVEPLKLEGNAVGSWEDIAKGGTWYLDKPITVGGTIVINSNTTLNLNGYTLKYGKDDNDKNFKGNMIEVQSGTLTVKDVNESGTVTGKGAIQGRNNAEKNRSTGSLVLVNGGTFRLESGTLTGNHKGTVPTTLVTTKAPETYSGAGVYVKSGTFNMTGGTISDNHTIYTDAIATGPNNYQVVDSLKFYYLVAKNTYKVTNNGKVLTNQEHEGYRYDAPLGQGGGVYVAMKGTFTMSGTANISNNHAGEGGGIYVTQGSENKVTYTGKFQMTGGSVSGNIAHLGEGGGIYIQSNNEGNLISGGSITNNETHTTEDLGGGGIYVENSSQLHLTDALITDNYAQGLGGGIAACIHGKIASFALNGAAVYGNHAPSAISPADSVGFVKSISMKFFSMLKPYKNANGNLVSFDQYKVQVDGYHTFIDSYHLWKGDTNFQNKAQDIFSAGSDTQSSGGAIVSNQMLGGLANWSGYARTGEVTTTIDETNNDVVKAGTLLALTAAPDPMPTQQAKVTISGNKSTKTHGGGLATNGLVLIGTKAIVEPNPVELQISKTFDGSEKEFTFGLFAENGTTPIKNGNKDVTATLKASSSKDGEATLTIPASAFTDLPGKGNSKDYTFKVKEINTSTTDGVDYDNNVYTVKVTVKTTVDTQKLGDASYTVTTHEAHLTSVSPSPSTTDNVLTFNNKVKRGSLVLNKNLALNNGVKLDSDPTSWTFQITLVDEKGNAVSGKRADGTIFNSNQTVEVTRDAPVTISDIPVGTKYTVTEVNKDTTRYVTSDEVTDARTIVAGSNNSVTIKNERLYGDLTVSKTVDWDATTSNAPNKDDKFTIVVNLGEGDAQVEANAGETKYAGQGVYTFTLKGGENGQSGESATITGIPTGIAYTVSESDLPKGYTNTNKDQLPQNVQLTENVSVNVENHYYNEKLIDKTIRKSWGTTEKVLQGESITVKLIRTADGKAEEVNTIKLTKDKTYVGDKVIDNAFDWTYTWKNLPQYTGEKGSEYVYSIEEVEVNYGEGALKEAVEQYLSNLTEDKNSGLTDSKKIFKIEQHPDDKNLIVIYGEKATDAGEHEVLGAFRASVKESDGIAFDLTNQWTSADFIGSGKFTLKKVNENGEPLNGAVFSLSYGKMVVYPEITTGANGLIEIGGLKEGRYTLQEVTPPSKYQKDNTIWNIDVQAKLIKVTAEAADGKISGWKHEWEYTANGDTQLVLTITNKIITNEIKIDKTLVLDGVIDDIPEDFTKEMFEFKIYPETEEGQFAPDEDGNLPAIPEDVKEVGTLEVHGDGVDTKKVELPYGWYILRETVTAQLPDYIHAGTEFVIYDNPMPAQVGINQIEIFIGEQGKIHEVHAVNHYTHDTGSLSVGKTVVGVPTDEAFQFKVKLTLPEAYVAAGMAPTVKIMEGDKEIKAEEPFEYELNGLVATGTVEVAHGQKAVIEGIPTHTKYEVNELNRGKYEETHGEENANKGTIEITEANAEANYEVSFTNTQWIGTSVSLGVRKILSYQDIENMSMVNRQFTFELFQLEEDNGPVKETKVGELKLGGSEFNLAPAGSFKLDYSHELNRLGNGQSQTFVYEIREVETAGQGYIWAPRMGFQVKVRVENGQYYAEIVDNDGNALTNVDFNNKINVFQGDKGKIQLGGLKNLNGSPSDRAFDFTLTDVTDPENPVLLETVQNAVSAEDRGVFKFAEIKLSAAGMTAEKYQVKNAAGDVESYQYKYEIREVSEGAGNLHIDRTVYTVIVDVKDIDGVMQVQKYAYIPVDAEGVEGEKVESDKPETIVFNNILTPPPPTDPPTTPDRPTTPPDEPVPDPEVPLTPGPEPEPTPEEPTPEVEIPGDDVPLAPAPEIPEEVVFDEDVPLAAMPPEEEIFDGDVPLANVPKTGDATGLWAALTALSGASLAALGLTKKRKDEDDEQA